MRSLKIGLVIYFLAIIVAYVFAAGYPVNPLYGLGDQEFNKKYYVQAASETEKSQGMAAANRFLIAVKAQQWEKMKSLVTVQNEQNLNWKIGLLKRTGSGFRFCQPTKDGIYSFKHYVPFTDARAKKVGTVTALVGNYSRSKQQVPLYQYLMIPLHPSNQSFLNFPYQVEYYQNGKLVKTRKATMQKPSMAIAMLLTKDGQYLFEEYFDYIGTIQEAQNAGGLVIVTIDLNE